MRELYIIKMHVKVKLAVNTVSNWHLIQLTFEIIIFINIGTWPRIIRICIIIVVYRY